MTLTDTTQPIVQDTPETALNGNRKLIRPRLPLNSAPMRKMNRPTGNGAHHLSRNVQANMNEGAAQPEPSHAEVFYFQKQVQAQTPMVVLLDDGEKLEGIIEWFDKESLKLRLTNMQRILVYKTAIKFIHKAGEATATAAAS